MNFWCGGAMTQGPCRRLDFGGYTDPNLILYLLLRFLWTAKKKTRKSLAEVYALYRVLALCFYPRDAMIARSLRQRRVRPSFCLSVCLSVRYTPVLCLAERKQDR